jgi:hypothetical protein
MRFAAPLLLISAGFGSILPAQLIDCDVSPTGYKIFLDDVAPAVSTPAAGDSVFRSPSSDAKGGARTTKTISVSRSSTRSIPATFCSKSGDRSCRQRAPAPIL